MSRMTGKERRGNVDVSSRPGLKTYASEKTVTSQLACRKRFLPPMTADPHADTLLNAYIRSIRYLRSRPESA
jgi:hypothetical protein